MTKQERNKIYKQAIDDIQNGATWGMSASIATAWTNDPFNIDLITSKIFPEFIIFKPIGLNDAYWLPKNDLKTREIILAFCIAMTE